MVAYSNFTLYLKGVNIQVQNPNPTDKTTTTWHVAGEQTCPCFCVDRGCHSFAFPCCGIGGSGFGIDSCAFCHDLSLSRVLAPASHGLLSPSPSCGVPLAPFLPRALAPPSLSASSALSPPPPSWPSSEHKRNWSLKEGSELNSKPVSHTYGPTSFQSDHHDVLCWLMVCTMI